MGARGPAPTPTAKLAARGSWRARARADAGEPQAPALQKLPGCPKRLTGEARKAWKDVGHRLIAEGLLTELDLDLLADLCVIQARLLDAEANLAKFGTVLVSESGGMYQSPYLAIANRCLAQLSALRAQFGMGPAARTRVRTAPAPEAPEDEAKGKSRFFKTVG